MRFQASGSEEFANAARAVRTEARIGLGMATADDLETMRHIAEISQGRLSIDARLAASEVALFLGLADAAEHEAELVAEVAPRHGLATVLRLEFVRARINELNGDHDQTVARAEGALGMIEDHVLAFGSTDLAVAARTHGSAIGMVGLRGGLNNGDASGIFGMVDRMRTLGSRTRTQEAPEIRDLLMRYRQARRADLERSILEADRWHGEGESAVLERRIRELAFTSRSDNESTKLTTIETVQDSLGRSEMLTFFEVGDELHRLYLSSGSIELTTIGSASESLDATAKVRMQLASALESATLDATSLRRLSRSLEALSERMFAGLAADRPLVLIPPESTFGIPWRLLPALESRTMLVNASPSAWMRAQSIDRPTGSRGSTVFVAGPFPAAAASEIADLGELINGSMCLAGEHATAKAVLDAIGNCSRIHFATHGTARADNPLFSSLELHDGPITLYELQDQPAPAEVILSSCSVGRARSYPGGLAIGMPAVLLAGGARTVVAAEVDVPDEPTRKVMMALYEHLEMDLDPAGALSAATASFIPGSTEHLTAAAFTAYGA